MAFWTISQPHLLSERLPIFTTLPRRARYAKLERTVAQQLLHQRHKTGIAGCLAKPLGVFVFDAMLIEMLEVLVGRIVKHGHDQEPLGQ